VTAAFMKISRDDRDLIDKMDAHYPRFGEQCRLPFASHVATRAAAAASEAEP